MPEKKGLPVYIQIIYGIGVSYAIIDQIFAQWVLTYYMPPANFNMPILLSPILLSLALVFSRFIDAVTDPLVGFLSDKFNSKFGRRIPFIAIGAIPLVLATIGFFFPPAGKGELSIFIYLSLVGGIFFVFYTIVGAPYNALIPEISSNSNERVNLSTWQSVFRLLYTAVAMILPGIMIKMFGKGDSDLGIKMMVVVLSLFALLGMVITVFGINERKYSGGKVSKESIKDSIGIITKNKAFFIYLIGFLFFFLGFNILRACMNYFVIDIMGKDEKAITLASAIMFGTAALCFFPVNLLSKKFGCKKPMVISLILLSIGSFSLFLLGRLIPVNFGYIIFAFIGIPVAGAAFIFPPAMLSEIAAVSTRDTGRKIEGLFFGIQGFFLKMAFLLSIAIIPVVLVSGSGVSFIESLVNRPEKVSVSGIYLTSIISCVCFIVSAFLYSLFKEERV